MVHSHVYRQKIHIFEILKMEKHSQRKGCCYTPIIQWFRRSLSISWLHAFFVWKMTPSIKVQKAWRGQSSAQKEMLDTYKNLICAVKTISIKISGKKNGPARESNCFYFAFHSLGTSKDGVGMAAGGEGCWVSTTQSMGEGISIQSSSPETTFLQKSSSSSSSGFYKSPMKATQQRQMHKYNILSGRFFIERPKHEAKYI